jgi:PAS domain S-box-containing protein
MRTQVPPRILFALGILVLGIVLSGMAYAHAEGERLLDQERQHLEAIANLKVHEISRWRSERLADAATAAETPWLRSALVSEMERRDPGMEHALATWATALERDSDTRSLFLVTLDGDIRFFHGSGTPDPSSLRGALQLAETGHPAMSDLRRDPNTGQPFLDVITPIRATPTSRPLGVLVLRDDPAVFLFPLIQVWPDASPSGETLLARREGDGVLYLNELRHRRVSALLLHLPLSAELPASRAVQGREGFFRGRDYRGTDVLSYVRGVPGTTWGLVAKVDSEDVFGRVRMHRVLTFLAVAGCVVAAVGWAAAIWRKQQSDLLHVYLDALSARRDLESRLGAIAEQARDIVVLLTNDLRIAEVNRRAAEVWGYSREELIGRKPSDLGIRRGNVSDEVIRQALEADGGVYETVHVRKDGTVFPVEVSARAMTLDGERYYQAIVRDITERKHAEEALRESEERLATTLNSIGDGVLATDSKGRIDRMNPVAEALTGWSFAEAKGHMLEEVFAIATGGSRVPAESPVRRALREGKVVGLASQTSLLTRSGEERPIKDSAAPIRNAEGEVKGVVLVFRDATDERVLEARLRLSDRLSSLGTLAAGVAHEINNPLTWVSGNLAFSIEALERDTSGPAAVADILPALREAEAGAGRVREIVRNLKLLSRGDEETVGPVDVVKTLCLAVSLTRSEVRHRAAVVTEFLNVAPVMANESRLVQVFINLLINAAQAIPEGHSTENYIRVSTRRADDGHIAISVEDTGTGIAPEIRHRIFDAFFTTKPVGEGTGLGLAICHAIVHGFGGEIHVESTVGKGTLFTVTLPTTDAPSFHVSDPQSLPKTVGPRRLLVIDDEPSLLQMITRTFAPLHTIVSANSGRDGLAKITHGSPPFDLVLCDLMMPGMSGIDFYNELIRVAPDLRAKTVFMTGGAFSQRAREFLEQTKCLCIEKPFEVRELREAVDGWLRSAE